ncbi:MAG: hypothetical protein ACRDSP_13225 [Pseudonocardiaceae bacterium]
MTNVWQTRNRLLTERLDHLIDSGDEDLARLAAAGYLLLTRHQVNKYGRCRYCCRSHWWPRRRKICTVVEVFAVAMTQPFTVVTAWLEDR